MKIRHFIPLLFPVMALIGCKNEEPNPEPEPQPPVNVDGEGETPDYDPEAIPTFSYTITPYGGETATDAVKYQTGNADLDPEANTWENVVTVEYKGETATVTAPNGVTYTSIGANIELKLNQVKNVKIVAKGSSPKGSLTINGVYKHLLELDNLTLTSTDRPAINDQIEKRVFLVLKGHSKIEDGSGYDHKLPIKRKGCFYAADHVILCGNGVLEIKGNNRHGFATDGFLFVNPGATLAVTDAKKNAISVDGSGINNGYRGIEVTGGYIYAHTSAPAGKAMKCDCRIALRGGKLNLNVSGDAAIDPEDGMLSSPVCLKSDSTIYISGGDIQLTSTGLGSKGITADFNLNIDGAVLNVANSGKTTTDGGDSSVAKALNAHGDISITAGGVYLSAIGTGSTAISTDANFAMGNGIVYAFGANYGIKSLKSFVNGGNFLCGGAQNTAVDNTVAYDYENIEAEKVTVLTDKDGKTTAVFRWPISLPKAQLLSR